MNCGLVEVRNTLAQGPTGTSKDPCNITCISQHTVILRRFGQIETLVREFKALPRLSTREINGTKSRQPTQQPFLLSDLLSKFAYAPDRILMFR